MSTTAIDMHDIAVHDAIPGRDAKREGFFTRLIAARTRHAEGRVRAFLERRSDASLADLGFTAAEIAEIRATGRIPAGNRR